MKRTKEHEELVTAAVDMERRLRVTIAKRINRLPSDPDVDDALQDVLVKLLTRGKTYDPKKSKHSTFVYRCTFNHCADVWRARQTEIKTRELTKIYAKLSLPSRISANSKTLPEEFKYEPNFDSELDWHFLKNLLIELAEQSEPGISKELITAWVKGEALDGKRLKLGIGASTASKIHIKEMGRIVDYIKEHYPDVEVYFVFPADLK